MSDEITFDDFAKVDVRVGRIVQADEFPQARKPAYKLRIDFGAELGIKTSSAQITKYYEKEDLIGKLVSAQAEHDSATDSEIIGFCILLMLAGNVTTTALLSSGLVLLADHPDDLEQLRADPSVIPTAVPASARSHQRAMVWAIACASAAHRL